MCALNSPEEGVHVALLLKTHRIKKEILTWEQKAIKRQNYHFWVIQIFWFTGSKARVRKLKTEIQFCDYDRGSMYCEDLLLWCRQGVYGGAFWAVNRPPCIVEVHTSVAKASLGLGSILKAEVQIYCAGAHKKEKTKEACFQFWPRCDPFVCDFFTPGREMLCWQP